MSMETILFPFEEVQKHSRIVLYGFGVAGQQYYRQVKKTNYCEIIKIVDKSYKKIPICIASVDPIESLFELQPNQYDYVVVAINNHNIAIDAKKELIQTGIKPNKIIISTDRGVGEWEYISNVSINTYEDILDYDKLVQYIKTSFYFNRKWAKSSEQYFPHLWNVLEKCEDKEFIINVFKDIVDELSDEEIIIILRLAYDLQVFDYDCMALLHKTVEKMEWNDDTPFGVIMDTSHMIHYGIAKRCMYPDFYIDRKRLMKKVCDYYDLKIDRGEKTKEIKDIEIKKIGILCFRLDISTDAAVNLVLKKADDFNLAGYEVGIFVTNTLSAIEDKKVFLKRKYVFEGLSAQEFQQSQKGYNNVYFAEEWDVKYRLQSLIDAVDRFHPDLIIDMSDEFCPQTYILQQKYWVICLPLRVGMSSSFFDYILEGDLNTFKEKNEIYRAIREGEVCQTQLSLLLDEDASVKYSKEGLGYKKRDFLIVTVGSRINYEISSDMISAMCVFLKGHKRAKWILVGDIVRAEENDLFNDLLIEGRIVNRGFEQHIEAFYEICDVYLEPPRNGGAHGMRLAMRKNLPIVISDYPSDGKTLFCEEELCHSLQDMICDLDKLYTDKDYYGKKAIRSNSIISDLTKESDAKKIIQALQKTNY